MFVEQEIKTPRPTDSMNPLHQYVQEMQRYPKELTSDQQDFLFDAMEMGLPIDYLNQSYLMDSVPEELKPRFINAINDSSSIRDFIANCYLHLPVYAAKRQRPGQGLMDGIQAGNEGLLHAVTAYTKRRKKENAENLQFGPYAFSWVRRYIWESNMLQELPLALTQNARNMTRVIIRFSNEFEAKSGRQPIRSEVKKALLERGYKVDTDNVLDLYFSGALDAPLSLDQVYRDTDDDNGSHGMHLSERIPDLDTDLEFLAIAEADASELMSLAYKMLTPFEAEVIRLSIGLGTSKPLIYSEIATLLGKSPRNVANVAQRARIKLLKSEAFRQKAELAA